MSWLYGYLFQQYSGKEITIPVFVYDLIMDSLCPDERFIAEVEGELNHYLMYDKNLNGAISIRIVSDEEFGKDL